jgi:ribA/ribD-fused uncharacterized protein
MGALVIFLDIQSIYMIILGLPVNTFFKQFFPHRLDLVEKICEVKTPKEAAKIGRDRTNPLRENWEDIKYKIMMTAVYTKFQQHPKLKQVLLSTGRAKLIEHTYKDNYWGDGGDGTGTNHLGYILMAVRAKLELDDVSINVVVISDKR